LIKVVATLEPLRVGVVAPDDVADWLSGEECTMGDEDRSRSRRSSWDESDEEENNVDSRFLPRFLYLGQSLNRLTLEDELERGHT
jgi:hypothetical protein